MRWYCCDLQLHTKLVGDFSLHLRQQGADLRSWTGDARMCALSMVLHMADIANVAKPRHLAVPWARNVTEGESNSKCHDRHIADVWLPASPAISYSCGIYVN